MSVDERDESPYATALPDLGYYAPAVYAARERDRERTRAAIACVTWHGDHEQAHRRDWVIGYVAAFFALASLLVAVLTVRETYAGALGLACVAAIVASAWRSGTKVNAERDHHAACGQCGGPS